jgi:hypothetical protein
MVVLIANLPRKRWSATKMRYPFIYFMASVTAGVFCLNPIANAKTCDCNQKLGKCNANKTYDGGQISFTADTNQCAQIIYSVDGAPDSITITDGAGSIDYTPTRPHTPQITIDSCSICKTMP